VKSLLEELSSLNSKFEATDAERSREQASHRDQIAALEAMKVKYEKAKTELRNLKGIVYSFSIEIAYLKTHIRFSHIPAFRSSASTGGLDACFGKRSYRRCTCYRFPIFY